MSIDYSNCETPINFLYLQAFIYDQKCTLNIKFVVKCVTSKGFNKNLQLLLGITSFFVHRLNLTKSSSSHLK